MSRVDEFQKVQQRVAATRGAPEILTGMEPVVARKTVFCIGFERDGSIGSHWWATNALRNVAKGLTGASRELPFELDVPADATVLEIDALVEHAARGKDYLNSRPSDQGPYSVVDNTDQLFGQLGIYHEQDGFIATVGTLSKGERRLPEAAYETARKIADGLNRAYLEGTHRATDTVNERDATRLPAQDVTWNPSAFGGYGESEVTLIRKGFTHALDRAYAAEQAVSATQSAAIPLLEEIAKIEGACTVHEGVLSLPDGTAINLNRLISTMKGQAPVVDDVEVPRPRMRI